ncbi:hypothetical protein [Pseudomarimonas arenosa]|uniref:Uncharacterized protein n=1 Tax=Pseudomarimonas arenosa TaxID=2774145 RepID=A0AAW3ZRC0_9GAMM|nr:hypothetical protein [Pseudomarimonas arenosa]MBD8527652.1 hypothetical protein [Pseudomarimonas arenosa]
MPSRSMRSVVRRACVLLAVVVWPAVGHGQDAANVEHDPLAQSPARQPLKAWHDALALLPATIKVRRLAFAHHGLFVFHSPQTGSEIHADFFSWARGQVSREDSGLRPSSMCTAAGVGLERIAPALQRLESERTWKQHQASMDTVVLECFRDRLYWSLMPAPAGGYQMGEAIATYDVEFDAPPVTHFDVE